MSGSDPKSVESGDPSAKPKVLLRSEALAIKVEQLLEYWIQKRDNDKKIMNSFEVMVRQTFEKMIIAYKEMYRKTYANDSTIKERITRLESILEDIDKREQMFLEVYNMSKAVVFGQFAEQIPKPVSKTEIIAKKVETLINELNKKRENDVKRLDEFERNIRLNIDRLIRGFNQEFLKTYATDEEVNGRLNRLEGILTDIKKIEDMILGMGSRFDECRKRLFVADNTNN